MRFQSYNPKELSSADNLNEPWLLIPAWKDPQ